MRIFCYVLLLLLISLKSEAQQVKKIDCCFNVTPKATIIINENAGTGNTSSTTTTSTNPANGVFNFELKSSLNTSAGVYNSSGVLIRTLWSGVRYDAGCYSGQWDGLMDNGTVAPNGSYNIKVLTNNVTYAVEGYIGNSSVNQSIKSFGGFGPFAFAGTRGYYGQSFAEGGVQTDYFDLTNIQLHNPINIDLSAIITGVATDGTNVYWSANNQYESPGGHFIFAIKVSDNTAVTFSAGTNHVSGRGATTANSVIGYVSQDNAGHQYTALTVQPNGNYLFAVRADTLYEFDKRPSSGALIRSGTYAGITRIAANSNNELWAIIGTTVKKYSIAADGTLTDSGVSIMGLGQPLSLAISPDNTTLSICDNASSQIKNYTSSNGSFISAYGQLNGYVGSPAATNNKFAFLAKNFGASYIAYLPDGSLWVNCSGEYCVKHLNANGTYIERVSYIPSFRSANIDENDPTSVFADELEFQRDYTKPLDNGVNGSWKLKNVWTPGTSLDIYGKFIQVVTLSNGHKYGYAGNALYDLRSTGAVLVGNIGSNYVIEADGTLYNRLNYNNDYIGITKQALTGFDSNFMPQWGAVQQVITTPNYAASNPLWYINNTRGSSTNSTRYIFFSPNANFNFDKVANMGSGYHLGSIKYGAKDFDWQTSKSTFVDYHGDYPRNGDYDVGNNDYSLQHSENCRVLVNGSDIFTQVNAEFWQANSGNSGVNIWNHFNEDGLLVGNFGVTGIEANRKGLPGMTGNGFTTALAKVGDTYHLVQCDESAKGAITCWTASNISSIQEQVISITLSANMISVADSTDLLAGLPYMTRNTFTGDANWTITSSGGSALLYTNYLSSDKHSPDLFVNSPYNQVATRTLHNSVALNTWSLNGIMAFYGGVPTFNYATQWSYLEVLDAAGKIIARFDDTQDLGNSYYHTTYINNQVVKAGNSFNGEYPDEQYLPLPFSFYYSNNQIVFTYNGFPAVTVTSTWDTGANMAKPSTLRINLGSNGANHTIDLTKAYFVKGTAF